MWTNSTQHNVSNKAVECNGEHHFYSTILYTYLWSKAYILSLFEQLALFIRPRFNWYVGYFTNVKVYYTLCLYIELDPPGACFNSYYTHICGVRQNLETYKLI